MTSGTISAFEGEHLLEWGHVASRHLVGDAVRHRSGDAFDESVGAHGTVEPNTSTALRKVDDEGLSFLVEKLHLRND